MRLLAILAAALVTAAGLTTALVMRGGPSSAHANHHAAHTRPVVAQATARVRPDTTATRVRLGIISYNLSQFVKQTGIHPALTSKYFNWGTPFPAAEVRANHRLGATTLIILEPRTIGARRIVAGGGNAYLARWAAAERKLGLPVMLAFAPEANGPWYPWGKGHISPAMYKKMYQKVHDVLLRDGVKHVTWVWQVNKITSKTERYSLIWPGRKYVNVIGVDGATFGGNSTFNTIFGPTLAQLRAVTSVPEMLSEVSLNKGRARPREVAFLFAGARKDHLTAVNFFDVLIWNFDNDQATLSALRTAARAR